MVKKTFMKKNLISEINGKKSLNFKKKNWIIVGTFGFLAMQNILKKSFEIGEKPFR